jgi:hypothetical protein
MSNPSGPDHRTRPAAESAAQPAGKVTAGEQATEPAAEPGTEVMPIEPAAVPDPEAEPATEVFSPADIAPDPPAVEQAGERRFTAPSAFDAGSTQQIDTAPDPATEILSVPEAPAGVAAAAASTEPMAAAKAAGPQVIPPRGEAPRPPRRRRSWGWVLALLLVIAALVAVAVLGTVLLTRSNKPKASQQDMVRSTIQNFDIAVQNGDLATLRSITCGVTRDSYVNYDDHAWADTHARVAAAKQYPVVASIDQVVVNGNHAEANVTTFMAYAPQTRSTRSFDLQFRDEQWKICQAPNS